MLRAVLIAVVLAVVCAAPAAALPPVQHVFVIVLENKNYEQSFGPGSPTPYLSKDLPAKGKLLTQYYGTSHASLGNYITMVSGQAANPMTQADCPVGFDNVFPGTPLPDGQVLGIGCVYPASVQTIAGQLEAAGRTWKGYMQDMGTPCRHPAIGEVDDTQAARQGDQYATRHNPFVYFHSIIDSPSCAANVVDLKALEGDLASTATTPDFAFITPNLCEDGHDGPCVDGRPGGLRSIDAFLGAWVPKILASPAMRDGMLIVTFDEAEASEASACCSEPAGPNTPSPGIGGPGGGRVGAIVVSPWVRAGTRSDVGYNHYSLLRSLEDLFGLGHLGYAGMAGLRAFGDDVYDGSGPAVCSLSVRVVGHMLVVTSPTDATLRWRVSGRRDGRTRSLSPCAEVRVRLPRGHGRARVSVGASRRVVRY
jgi:hypothetical protein